MSDLTPLLGRVDTPSERRPHGIVEFDNLQFREPIAHAPVAGVD